MGVHGEGVHATNIGVRYVAYFQAIFPMSFHHTQIKVKPPKAMDSTARTMHVWGFLPPLKGFLDPARFWILDSGRLSIGRGNLLR